MSKHIWDPVASHPGDLVRPVPIDPSGRNGPTKRQASIGHYWRRTSRGFYVPADTRSDLPEQRIMEQSVRLPTGGAVTGWAGCRLHGAQFFDGLGRDGLTLLPVPLALGLTGRIRRDDQVELTYDAIAVADRASRHGVPTLTAVRCVVDAMRHAPGIRDAVVAADMMAAARLVSLDQIRSYAATCWLGSRAIKALELASEYSRSPNETRLRLVWILDAGLPTPQVNCAIRDRNGTLLGVADLIDLEAGLVVEFDGADHRSARGQTRDITKDEALRRVGLEVVRVTGLQLMRPDQVAHRLRAARQCGLFQPRDDRAWFATQDSPYDRHPSSGVSRALS